MTENEAIERLKCMRLFMQINDKSSESKFLEEDYIANKLAIEALEEVQQYREIGTVEECQEARERQRGKKPILDTIYHQQYYCPNCEDFLVRKNGNKPHHCICGQAIDWSE